MSVKHLKPLFPPLLGRPASSHVYLRRSYPRAFFTTDGRPSGQEPSNAAGEVEELSAMSQRLQDLKEESDLLNPRATIRRMQQQQQQQQKEADGLSDAVKEELLSRIKDAEFNSDNAAAVAYSKLPAHASKHTRDIAMSTPWSGTESTFDASLRMLNDAHKPMKVKPAAGPPVNNTLRAGPKLSTPRRVINARDAAGKYGLVKKPEDQMTPEEREEVKRILRERFSPEARTVPATVEGLAALANEKIEDAVARGVFRDLPNSGKPMEVDHHANSAFIDTTSYLLNRAIQRQEVTLPWIDRQKTLLKEAAAFRSRLRATWKRHVIRVIASTGSGPEEWIRRAEEFAEAERVTNPDPAALLKQKEDERENKWRMDGRVTQVGEQIRDIGTPAPTTTEEGARVDEPTPPRKDLVAFRDATWLATESGYHNLAVKTLNAMVMSYNLECPTIAQKPYYNLDFELRAAYRTVAKEVVTEFRERASNPDFGKYLTGDNIRGDTDRLAQVDDGEFIKAVAGGFGEKRLIYEERKEKAYGFKEFLRDIFSKNARA